MTKKILTFLLLLTLVCLAQSRYHDERNGFSIVPPAGWNQSSDLEEGDHAAWISPDEMCEMTVTSIRAGEGSFKDFDAALKTSFEEDGNQVLEHRPMTFGGREGSLLVVAFEVEGMKMTTYNSIISAPPLVYMVTVAVPTASFPIHAKAIKAASESFLVEEGP